MGVAGAVAGNATAIFPRSTLRDEEGSAMAAGGIDSLAGAATECLIEDDSAPLQAELPIQTIAATSVSATAISHLFSIL
jgi:hypothetical protein